MTIERSPRILLCKEIPDGHASSDRIGGVIDWIYNEAFRPRLEKRIDSFARTLLPC